MLGLALQDYDREVTGRPERLVQSYVEAAISQPEIKDIAPRVIEKMITDANTKQPRSVTDLASDSALSNQDVIACLILLERKGLVRRLGDLWEISHDFVARQFSLLLGRMQPSQWPKIGMFVASGLFVLILGGLVFGLPMFVKLQAFDALQSLRISVTRLDDGKPFAKFPAGATDTTMTSALPYLILVAISHLDLSGSQVTTLPSLDKLPALKTLNLSNSQVTTLPSLDKLTALETLDLSDLPVRTLPSGWLDKLTALKTLNLSDLPVRTLPSLDKLTALETLNLRNSRVTTLPSLDKLTALKTLNLGGEAYIRGGVSFGAPELTTLQQLDKLTALETLDLSGSPVTTLPTLDKLTALKTLNLSNSQVTTLQPLDKLTALETLDLSRSRVTTLPSLDKLTALKTLNLSHLQVTTLQPLDKLAALITLDLSYSKVTMLPSLNRLTALRRLDLTGRLDLLDNVGLQQLRARGVTVIGFGP